MTREEIIAQAKVGGFAVVRARLPSVFGVPDIQITVLDDDGDRVYFDCENVIAIEPPLKSDAEKLADALAEIERLNGLLAIDPMQEKPWMPGRLDGYGPWIEGLPKEPNIDDVLLFDVERLHKCYRSVPIGGNNFAVAHCLKEDPNTWRDHDGDDMPCNEDLIVEGKDAHGAVGIGHANEFKWSVVKLWRPHVEVG